MAALKETSVDRREEAADAMVLQLLDAVESNAAVTQRHLAQELGIALGLANTYFKRCVNKGLLKVAVIPSKRYAYYLTPQGFAEKSRLTARYLAVSFNFLRSARIEMGELFEQGSKNGKSQFLLIGEGDLADVAMLMAARSAVDVAATLPSERDSARLAEAARGFTFDAAVITATDYPQEVFAAAVAAFGADQVLTPRMLRIRRILTDPTEVKS